MADIHPDATFVLEGDPDWMVVTEDAVPVFPLRSTSLARG
jgi:hypothetical protein